MESQKVLSRPGTFSTAGKDGKMLDANRSKIICKILAKNPGWQIKMLDPGKSEQWARWIEMASKASPNTKG